MTELAFTCICSNLRRKRVRRRAAGPESALWLNKDNGGLGREETGGWRDMDVVGVGDSGEFASDPNLFP